MRKILAILLVFWGFNPLYAQFQGQIHISNINNKIPLWHAQIPTIQTTRIIMRFDGAGMASDPAGKMGLSNFAASMANEGAGPYNGDEFQRILRDNSISFIAHSEWDYFEITLSFPNKYRDVALSLFEEYLTRPQYGEEEFALNKRQIINAINEQDHDGDYILARAKDMILYPNHPYNNQPMGNGASIHQITPADLMAFHQQYLTRHNMKMVISGNITAPDAKNIAQQIADNLPDTIPPTRNEPAIVALPNILNGQVIPVPLPQPLSQILWVQTAPPRMSDDFWTAYMINDIMGGSSLESILSKEIREKRGLTYSIGTYISHRKWGAEWLGYASTKTSDTDKITQYIRQNWQNLAENISEKQLKMAQKRVIGRYALGFTNNTKIANILMNLLDDGFTPEYFQQRVQKIQAVNLKRIREFAQRAMNNDNIMIFYTKNNQ